MVGKTNVSGKFVAMQMDKQPTHCLVDDLVSFERILYTLLLFVLTIWIFKQTPTGVVEHAALRFGDILSVIVPASEIPPFLDQIWRFE